MIRTNLATRHPGDAGTLRTWLGLAAALAVLATVWNTASLLHYARRDTQREAQAARDEATAVSLRAEAAALRTRLATADSQSLAAAAEEARSLVTRRVFSWTELFNRFETTLPPRARITSVRPGAGTVDRSLLEVSLVAGSVEDVDRFLGSLEAGGAFVGVLSRDERRNASGQIEASIETAYVPAEAGPPSGGPSP